MFWNIMMWLMIGLSIWAHKMTFGMSSATLRSWRSPEGEGVARVDPNHPTQNRHTSDVELRKPPASRKKKEKRILRRERFYLNQVYLITGLNIFLALSVNFKNKGFVFWLASWYWLFMERTECDFIWRVWLFHLFFFLHFIPQTFA